MVVVIQKGLILVEFPDAQKGISVLLGLLHEGAYTSRCQMPEEEQQIVSLLRTW